MNTQRSRPRHSDMTAGGMTAEALVDVAVQALAGELGQATSVSLKFGGCSKLTDAAVQALAGGLHQALRLQCETTIGVCNIKFNDFVFMSYFFSAIFLLIFRNQRSK